MSGFGPGISASRANWTGGLPLHGSRGCRWPLRLGLLSGGWSCPPGWEGAPGPVPALSLGRTKLATEDRGVRDASLKHGPWRSPCGTASLGAKFHFHPCTCPVGGGQVRRCLRADSRRNCQQNVPHEQRALDCLNGAGGAAWWRWSHVLTGRADHWHVNVFPVTFFLGAGEKELWVAWRAWGWCWLCVPPGRAEGRLGEGTFQL